MSSTSSRWSTWRRRTGYAWWNRRGGPRWCISPFPLTPSWLRHSFSCVMVELAILSTNPPECTWNRLETMDSLQISFKTPSPTHTTHSQPISSLQMTKRKPKICFKAKTQMPFSALYVSCFQDSCPVLGTRSHFMSDSFFCVPKWIRLKVQFSQIEHKFRSNHVRFDPLGTQGASTTNPVS